MAEGGDWQERFSRQIVLPQLGEDGQLALGRATVVIVGAGGLGSTSAETLVRMGLGQVRVIDPDVVELSNLHRVRAYGDSDVGRPKVQVLAERLTGLIEGATIEPVRQSLVPANALELRALLEGQPLAVPDELLEAYPRLKRIAQPPREPGLFDGVPE